MSRGRSTFTRADLAEQYAEYVRAVAALWPVMSIRDIAIELDRSVSSVEHAARKAGFPHRPAAAAPGPYGGARE